MKQSFVIFDRDGTLIDHVHHLVNPGLVQTKSDLGQALRLLQNYDFKFGIILKLKLLSMLIAVVLKLFEFPVDIELIKSLFLYNYLK